MSANLLETHFDRTLADLGVGRRHWQVLNTLSRGPRTRDTLHQALAPFWEAGEGLGEVLDGTNGLAGRGWIAENGATITLTEQGRAEHARISARIDQSRAVVLGELTPEQYVETVRILSVLADNVQADLAARGA